MTECRRAFDIYLKHKSLVPGEYPGKMICEGGIQIAFSLGEELDEETVRAKFEEALTDLKEADRMARTGDIAALMALWDKRRQTMPASSEQWL